MVSQKPISQLKNRSGISFTNILVFSITTLCSFSLVCSIIVSALMYLFRTPSLTTQVHRTDDDKFKNYDDDTAYIVGEVYGYSSGCEVDSSCSISIRSGDLKATLIYNEGDSECLNTQASAFVRWGENIKPQTRIKAYGKLVANSLVPTLTFCNSTDYFIVLENNPIPIEIITRKTLDRISENKINLYADEFKEAKSSGAFETYVNKDPSYLFLYPATWSNPQTAPGAPEILQYYDFTNPESDYYNLEIGYITKSQLSTMGDNYCDENSDDPRCEIRRVGSLFAQIDWGLEGDSVLVRIPDKSGNIVTMNLFPYSEEAADQLNLILSSFRFVN